jgi:hypothetical protein
MNRYRKDLNGPTYHFAQKDIRNVMESSSWIALRRHIPKINFKYPYEWKPILNDHAYNQYQIFHSRKNHFDIIGDLSIIKNICEECY